MGKGGIGSMGDFFIGLNFKSLPQPRRAFVFERVDGAGTGRWRMINRSDVWFGAAEGRI
jgi:hypothetical protein